MKKTPNDFDQLYQDYSDDVYRFILMRLGDPQKAEDLTQDTFIRAFKAYNRFNGEASVKTWLFTIARNITVDYFRAKKQVLSLPNWIQIKLDGNNPTPPEIIELGEEVQLLYEAIKKLKKPYQEVLILRKIQEFPVEESAKVLNWSISKVKSTTYRAMKALKHELLKGGEFDEKAIK